MIPISKDTRALIGEFAEQADNRSLLYEKFALPKLWGQRGKLQEAGRWTVLRIVTRGSELLLKDAGRMDYVAAGRNVRPDNAERLRFEAQLARRLAVVAPPDMALAEVAVKNARSLLADLGKCPGCADLVSTFEAHLGGRLLINMAGGVVENAGVCLDRCFGLPYLPGSAVKGVARAQALLEIKEASGEAKQRQLQLAMLLFGFGGNDLSAKGDLAWAAGQASARAFADTLESRQAEDRDSTVNEFKGLASFLPAYPTEPPTLVVDMVNPHHREYYRSRGDRAPSDDEDPMPNYFPAVEAGSAFGFAVILNRVPAGCPFQPKELLEAARRWLESAISRKGVGAKTGAGYGWFFTPGQEPPGVPRSPSVALATPVPATAPQPPADPIVQKWRGKLGATGNFPAVLPDLTPVEDIERLRRVFDAIFPEPELHSLKAGKRTPYWQSFASRPQGTALLLKLGYRFRK